MTMIVMMKKNKENNKNSYALATGIILGLCILTIAAYGLVLFFSNRWEALHHSSSMPYYRSIVEKEEGSYALFDEDENQISDEYEELDEEDLQSGRYFVRYGKMKDGEMHRGFVNVLTGKEEWEVDGACDSLTPVEGEVYGNTYDSMTVVQRQEKYAVYVFYKGFTTSFEYDSITQPRENSVYVLGIKDGDTLCLIDAYNGEVMEKIEGYQEAEALFGGECFRVKSMDGKYGIVNSGGKLVVEARFDKIEQAGDKELRADVDGESVSLFYEDSDFYEVSHVYSVKDGENEEEDVQSDEDGSERMFDPDVVKKYKSVTPLYEISWQNI